MHVVQLDDSRVEVSEETRPVVLEVLCDECESALKFEEFEDTLRKEVLLTVLVSTVALRRLLLFSYLHSN
jgi:hypothetical protein